LNFPTKMDRSWNSSEQKLMYGLVHKFVNLIIGEATNKIQSLTNFNKEHAQKSFFKGFQISL
jgi:hypothetical protein